MIGRTKDYICLTSISLALNLAVSLLRVVRHQRHAGQNTSAHNMSRLTSIVPLSDTTPLQG